MKADKHEAKFMAYTDQLINQLFPDPKKHQKNEQINLLEGNHYQILRNKHAYGIELFLRLLNNLSLASLICLALYVLQIWITNERPFGVIFDLQDKSDQDKMLYFAYDAGVCFIYVIAIELSKIYLTKHFKEVSKEIQIGV